MSCLRTSEDEENKAQAKFTADLKSFAVRYKVAVILVAHPRKTKPGEVFTSDDISGSSAISNLADTVLNIEKTEIGTSIRVTKNRDFGRCGVIECMYNPVNRRIYESAIGDRIVYGWDHNGISVPEHQAKYDNYFVKPVAEFGQQMHPW